MTTRSSARTRTAGAALAFGDAPTCTTASIRPTSSSRSTPTSLARRRRATCGTRATSPTAAACASAKAEMNRLYVAEPTPTPTGSIADHRLPRARQPDRGHGARRSRRRSGGAAPARSANDGASTSSSRPLAKDLPAHHGARPRRRRRAAAAAVHALAHAINQALGNIGTTVVVTDPIVFDAVDQTASLRDARRGDMNAGAVQLLSSSARTRSSPRRPTSNFAEALEKVATARPRRPLRRRDRGALPLARAVDALPRGVERRARRTTAPPRSCSR